MKKDYKLEKIKQAIELKREELNMIVIKGLNQDKILRASQDLDILIAEYYLICKE